MEVIEYKRIVKKVGKQEVYLYNDFEEIVIRIPIDHLTCYAKGKGEKEYPLEFTSVLVTDTLIDGSEIDKSFYQKY